MTTYSLNPPPVFCKVARETTSVAKRHVCNKTRALILLAFLGVGGQYLRDLRDPRWLNLSLLWLSRSDIYSGAIALALDKCQMASPGSNARMAAMMPRLLLFLALVTLGIASVAAQDTQSVLLARINSLRRSQGLPPYSISVALNSAAKNHAIWMARTGKVSHQQDDGTGPRTRARNAGYSSNWVSENIYRGLRASALEAWNWWLGSPTHYAGITSPNYDNVGVGSASGEFGTAYVLVFGNSLGRAPASRANGTQLSAGLNAPAAPSFVLGIDDVGNIKHEIQTGDTIGNIALIYGYTWADIPYMLEINDMALDDIRLIQPGDVFLVPPKDGTFTPAPATPASTQDAQPLERPASEATSTARPFQTAAATPFASPVFRIGLPPGAAGAPPASRTDPQAERDLSLPLVLAAAIVLQLGILGGAVLELARRSR